MNMTVWDWAMIVALLTFLTYMVFYAARHSKSVADFLSASRCAGRYVLSNASGMAAMGAISIILNFEVAYKAGFAPGYWGVAAQPLLLFITLSGWGIYRYRQTRALTLAQFFEMRYTRRFRIFAGFLCWISGIINYGIFPGVGARFFVNFCGLPQEMQCGGFTFPTFWLVMIILMSLTLSFAYKGGQITVLVTDFWQGFFSLFLLFAIVLFVMFTFSWEHISESLVQASEPGKSLINPYDIGHQPDFNIYFYAMVWVLVLYKVLSWQGAGSYNTCATTAHELKMAGAMGGLRQSLMGLVFIMMPIAAIVVMNHPEYTDMAARVTDHLSTTFADNKHMQTRMIVPTVLSYILPKGLVGAFAAAMLAFFISTNNTYMHSWGTIFIQDVVVPLRGKPFTPQRHVFWLRMSIVFVAVFSVAFSMIFELRDYIQMFFAVTGAIFIGGAGAAILGGLYWKRGNTAAAYAAMIVGSVFALTSIVAQNVWPHIPQRTAAWYHLDEGQVVQLTGRIQEDPCWVQQNLATEDLTAHDAATNVLFESSSFSVGQQAQQPLPQQESRIIYGTEMLVGPIPTTAPAIVADPVELKDHVFRARIVTALGDHYYVLADEDQHLVAKIVPPFPVNGQVLDFTTCVLGVIVYVLLSILVKTKPANMDKLLHRGEYAIKSEEEDVARQRGEVEKPMNPLWKLIGVNSREFSRLDKGIFLFLFTYTVWVMASFFVLMALQWFKLIGNNGWLLYWKIGIGIQLCIAAVAVPWVAIGGLFDLKRMYHRLSNMVRNDLDDGRVTEDIHEE